MDEALKKGLSSKEKITQDKPRDEVKGSQKPVVKEETVNSDRGTFKIK
jgi:hypothetical protein